MKNLAKVLALVLIVAMFAVMLTACAPKNVKDATEKMEEAGYYCFTGTNDTLNALIGAIRDAEGAQNVFMCAKGDNMVVALTNIVSDSLVAVLFDTKANAKASLEDYTGDKAKVIGKWVVIGSEDAVKAFK